MHSLQSCKLRKCAEQWCYLMDTCVEKSMEEEMKVALVELVGRERPAVMEVYRWRPLRRKCW